MRSLRAWVADVLLGPACPHGCGYRARVDLSPRGRGTAERINRHCHLDHADGK